MKKLNFKDIVFYIIVLGAAILLGSIALASIFIAGPSIVKMPFYSGFAYLIIAALVVFLIYRLDIISKINAKVFIVLLIIITLVPRLIWVSYVQTQPFSDFLHLHDYGINASQGNFKGFVNFYAVFPFKIGYGMVLAALYSVFGADLMVVKSFNIVLSVILVLMLYAGGKLLYGEKAGRIAALLAALWPAQIMYTSVVASEHLFLVLFTASVLLIITFVKKYTYKNYEFHNGNLMLAGIGIITAAAQLVRPMAMILLPVFAVFILLYKKYRASTLAGTVLAVKSIVLVIVCYFALINLVNIPVQKATGVDITKSDAGFNLLVGTNYKYNGAFNNEDFSIIEKNNYDFDKVHKEAKQIALQRLKNNPAQMVKLIINKYKILWGNENYGYYWSTVSSEKGVQNDIIKSHPRIFYGISQLFYIVVLLMAIFACGYTIIRKRYEALIILMVFGGILLSYTLLEVQSRYHMPVMPLLILFGASVASKSNKFEV